MAEGALAAGWAELEHAAEPLVVEPGDCVLMGGEARLPVQQRLRVAKAQDFDIGRNPARPLDRWGHLAQRWRVAAGDVGQQSI